MQAKLIVVGGRADKAEVPLKLPALIGRGRDAQLTIAHTTVSRRHCLVYELDGVLMVQDKGSLNGTFIDGERVDADRILRPGQTLTVGPLTFRAEYETEEISQDVLDDAPAAESLSDARLVQEAHEPDVPPAALEPPVPPPAAMAPPLPPPVIASEPADEESGEFALPVEVEPESEPGQFDFLADQPIADKPAPAAAPAMSGGDSGEIFSFAEEPQEIEEPKANRTPPDKKSKPSKTKGPSKPSSNGESDRAADELPQIKVGSAEPAPAVHQSDDDLNNFFESIGLE